MSPAGVGPAEEGAARLRVASYNLRQLRGDREALVEVLRTLAADVVAVQEPPRGPRGRRRLAQLAATAGLGVAVVGRGARTTALLVRSGLPVTVRGTCATCSRTSGVASTVSVTVRSWWLAISTSPRTGPHGGG